MGALYWLLVRDADPRLCFSIFLIGFAVILAALLHAMKATPRSRVSGRPMLRFRRSDSAPGSEEIIYVDPQTRTYFCRVVQVAS